MASPNSPSVNPPASPIQAPAEKPPAPPINFLSSQLAHTYSYVHPALLLSLCALRFDKLVANPAQELLTDLPWLTALQISYVLLCIPPAGSTVSTEAISPSTESDDKKKATPRSPSSPAVTLRPGKPGYRRKHHTGKHGWAGVWAKLMVWEDCGHLDIQFTYISLSLLSSPCLSPLFWPLRCWPFSSFYSVLR